MKHFQIVIDLPPNQVMLRLATVVREEPTFSFSNVGFNQKESFLGNLKGNNFNFRRYKPHTRNSFAPSCFGSVTTNQKGESVVDFRIGAKYTFFFIFAVIFVGVSTVFAILFGIISMTMMFTAQSSTFEKALVFLPFLIPFGAAAFLFLLLKIGKTMGNGDEQQFVALFQNLFQDVIVEFRRLNDK